MRPRQDKFNESDFIDLFKKLFKDCYSEEDYQKRIKTIYKGENPETLTNDERDRFILSYLYPEKSEKQIEKELFEKKEKETQFFEYIENFSKELDKIELPELDLDSLDFELPDIEIDTTEIDKVLKEGIL